MPELVHHLPRNLRGETRLPAPQGANRLQKFVFAGILQQVSLRTRANRLEYGFIIVQRCEHQNLGVRLRHGDFARRGHAALDRHVQIHEHHVRTQNIGQLHSLITVALPVPRTPYPAPWTPATPFPGAPTPDPRQ